MMSALLLTWEISNHIIQAFTIPPSRHYEISTTTTTTKKRVMLNHNMITSNTKESLSSSSSSSSNSLMMMAFETSPVLFGGSSSSILRLQMTSSPDNEEEEVLSFIDAGAALVDQEDEERAGRSGNLLTDETQMNYDAKSTEYDSMRDSIRSRASDLNIQKSVATQQAVEEAERRALNREDSSPQVDLSKIRSGLGNGIFDDDPEEDELTPEQMANVDKIGQMPIFEQVIEEFKNTKFPGPEATVRQAIFMFGIFIITASYILFLDNSFRTLYEDVLKIVPKPGSTFDYSDLPLPEGWTDFMD